MSHTPFIQKLTAQGPVLTDGACGTQLQARGLAPGETPDLWNLTQPEKVAEVARAYVEAGSQKTGVIPSGTRDRILQCLIRHYRVAVSALRIRRGLPTATAAGGLPLGDRFAKLRGQISQHDFRAGLRALLIGYPVTAIWALLGLRKEHVGFLVQSRGGYRLAVFEQGYPAFPRRAGLSLRPRQQYRPVLRG